MEQVFADANVSSTIEGLELQASGPFRCSQSTPYLVDKEGLAFASQLTGLDWLLVRAGDFCC
jgi:hypothetical protein